MIDDPAEVRLRAAEDSRDQRYARWEWFLAGALAGTVLTGALVILLG